MRITRPVKLLPWASLAALLQLACQPSTLPPLNLPEGCQPLLAGHDCMAPYPSDAFLVEDGSQPSGHRVQMGRAAQLLTKDGYSADVNDFMTSDGFSRFGPLVALLGVEVSQTGLTGIFDDPQATLRADSPTLIIEADSGRLIPHFVDLDPRTDDPLYRAVVLRPLIGLRAETRYVVALHGLKQPDGQVAPAPEGFRRIRDGQASGDAQLAPQAQRFDRDVFAVLEAAGVSRDSVQLAWDFTTQSERSVTQDMFAARALVLAQLDRQPPEIVNIAVVEDQDARTWLRVVGNLRGPLVMEHDGPGAAIHRDDAGQVALNGTTTFPFTILIPQSVKDQRRPCRSLQFGHGFFGNQSEAEGGAVRRISDELHACIFAIDWWGMSAVDVGVVISAIGEDVWRSSAFVPRVVQGMMNWLVLTRAMQGVLAEAPELHRPVEQSPKQSGDGALLYDRRRIDYLGISMGHILGGVYVALNPVIHRAIFNVGGASLSHMMFRAIPFERFLFVMDISMPDPFDQQKLAASLQMQFDRIDPATYAHYLQRDDLPQGSTGLPQQRRILMQAGVADTFVPNMGTYLHARLLDLPVLQASARRPYGLDVVDGPVESALTIYDLGYDDSFYSQATFAETDNGVHGLVRQQPEVIEQMRRFLEQGQVADTCGGSCVLR